jgi:hypothetical protein
MINDIGTTKWQLEYEENLYNGMQEALCPGYSNQSATQPPVHDRRVVQGLANGHFIVISHDCGENHLYPSKNVFSKELNHTSFKEDGLPLSEGVHNHIWCDNRREAGIKKGQESQEVVHGGMQQCRAVDNGQSN